jgi:hypothetical protein
VCELKVRSPLLTFSLVLGWIHFDNGVKYICWTTKTVRVLVFCEGRTSCEDEVGPERVLGERDRIFFFFLTKSAARSDHLGR